MMERDQTTADRLREFSNELDRIAKVFDERVSTKEAMINRLTYIFGDDPSLAKTVYDYVVLGHLSYCNQLRSRLHLPRQG